MGDVCTLPWGRPESLPERRAGNALRCAADPLFDAAYPIEGAPLRLIRAILDAEVRRALVALQPDRVLTTATALVIELPGWIEDGERAALSVRTAARLGALGAEIGRREIAGVGPSDTSGYRGLVAPGTRARDLQALDALRDRGPAPCPSTSA